MRIHLAISLAALALLAGCGHARLVNRTAEGGTVAIPSSDDMKSREKAEALMAQHCQGSYTIAKEGEEVIGTTSEERGLASVGSSRGFFSGKASPTHHLHTSTTTTNRTEWRISYRCGK